MVRDLHRIGGLIVRSDHGWVQMFDVPRVCVDPDRTLQQNQIIVAGRPLCHYLQHRLRMPPTLPAQALTRDHNLRPYSSQGG
jgi:hypothetical protein